MACLSLNAVKWVINYRTQVIEPSQEEIRIILTVFEFVGVEYQSDIFYLSKTDKISFPG